MGHFGFSYIGFIFLLMLTIPNLIWTKCQPKGYDYQNENKVLLVFERAGQVCVTCTAAIWKRSKACINLLSLYFRRNNSTKSEAISEIIPL